MAQFVEILTNEYTFTLKGYILLVVAIFLLTVVIAATYYIYNLNKKLNYVQAPKFGFLGKPLYQFVALAFLLGLFSISIVAISSGPVSIEDSMASQELGINFEYEILSIDQNEYELKIDIVPTISNINWGDNQEFDILVKILGPSKINQFLYDKTAATKATFVDIFKKGNYSIEITVITGETSKVFFEEINL
jgi:hypothetical protein